MTYDRVFWRRRTIFPDETPRKLNPLFPEKHRPERGKRVWAIVFWFVFLVCVASAIYGLFFSSIFRVEYVIVQDNRFTPTEAVVRQVNTVVQKKLLAIIPRNNLLLLSSAKIRQQILSTIGVHQAIETVSVQKRLPASIVVSLKERTPNLVYSNNGTKYLLDRKGIVTKAVTSAERINPAFPTLIDQTTRVVTIGKAVTSSKLVDFLFGLQDQLRSKTDIPIDSFFLPPLQCEKFFAETGTGESSLEETVNGTVNDTTNVTPSTNSETNTSNRNVNRQVTTNTSLNKNLNFTTPLNVNTNGTGESPTPVCDLAAVALKNVEVSVKTSEGWTIRFRSDDSLDAEIMRLTRVLHEKNPDRTKLSYIDLRFGDRVIIK